MPKLALISDLHLTDNPREEYRWSAMEWVLKILQSRREDIAAVVILGDLTELKDHHSGALVNRVVDLLLRFSRISPLYILRGNHDGTEENPFFGFLGSFPNIVFFSSPEGPINLAQSEYSLAFLPHMKSPHSGIPTVYSVPENWRNVDLILTHNTFEGGVFANGYLPGGGIEITGVNCPIFSGHLHVPQSFRNVTYIGSPYPVDFNDPSGGRIILLEKGKRGTLIRIPSIRRYGLKIRYLEELERVELSSGDHLDITVLLPRAELQEWDDLRNGIVRYCHERGVELFGVRRRLLEESKESPLVKNCGITPVEILKKYSNSNKLSPECLEVGLRCLA